MDNSGRARQPYRSPVLRPLGTLTDLTQGFKKSGPQDNPSTSYCGFGHEGEEPGTGGSGLSV
jgi:hypothetical protein